MAKELTPPDLKQCQADKPGNGPFILGGEIGDPTNGYRIRCKTAPTVIATEREPGEDGQRGSMSLCDACKVVFLNDLGADYATFETILENVDGKEESK